MMKKTIFYAILFLFAVAIVSCKKEEEKTKPSLSGLTIISDHDTFMGEGTEVHLKADVSDLYTSDTKYDVPDVIGIYYSYNGVRDTVTTDVKKSNPEYTITVGEAGNYSVFCYAYAGDDFYNASASVSFTAVDPETSLTGLPELPTVEIGGYKFLTAEIGGKTWLANNFYGTKEGTDYQDSEILSSLFGKYYTWEEAQTVCPQGWHLPSAEEFDECLGTVSGDLMVNAQFVSKNMWNYWPQVVITTDPKFCALPVGYRDFTYEDVPEHGYKQYACFWTSDEDEDKGEFRSIFEQESTVQKSQGDKKTLALSVRCVKD